MTLVFATHNANKLREIQALMPNYNLKSLTDIGCTEDIIEDAETIEGNALLKAKYVKENPKKELDYVVEINQKGRKLKLNGAVK